MCAGPEFVSNTVCGLVRAVSIRNKLEFILFALIHKWIHQLFMVKG
ncbi:hypothetical protein SAMN05216516_106114 [Izhakiella capsodis]|uniref:Uncharacterized protein n=1 Tax=Izhakiella capsodis TaxID=1367852 RepID=A0A1I4YH53_9GAMM|nr:hypothetical protein SAMN05216516_106114 [Izhakiella capsodis]